MKTCSRCNEVKALSEFDTYRRSKDGVRENCKYCSTLKHKETLLDAQLFYNYRIGLSEYREMSNVQGNKCKICNIHQQSLNLRLCVDHCHKTGKIRGLLCSSCNRALGFFRDNPEYVLAAYKYLLHHTTVIERAA